MNYPEILQKIENLILRLSNCEIIETKSIFDNDIIEFKFVLDKEYILKNHILPSDKDFIENIFKEIIAEIDRRYMIRFCSRPKINEFKYKINIF